MKLEKEKLKLFHILESNKSLQQSGECFMKEEDPRFQHESIMAF